MEKEITVVSCQPGMPAEVIRIPADLSSMQAFVGGYIEAVYPFEEPVCIVCNEEAKLIGMPLNRGLYAPDGELYDIIAGPFFICDCSGEDFGSLSESQQKRYCEQYHEPELFVRAQDGIHAIKLPDSSQDTTHHIRHRK